MARQVVGRYPKQDGRGSPQVDLQDAADRLVAIAAHRRRLCTVLRREVSFAVAALDYLLHVGRELAAPGAVELEVLGLLDRRLLDAHDT